MARRWQLSVWVLAALILTVIALWDNATVSAVAHRVTERTVTVDSPDRTGGGDPAPSDLAFSDLDGTGSGAGLVDGGGNVLRPTTTTTTRPTTTTTSTTARGGDAAEDGTGTDGEQAPGSAATTPLDGESPETTGSDGSSTTAVSGSSTVIGPDPALTTVYDEDFSTGALAAGRWSVADAVGVEGWGLLRPAAVTVVPDPSASGGHALSITARMGSGADAGRIVSGAVRLLGHPLIHGRYTIRARVDADADQATAGVVVLQPAGSGATAAEEIRILDTSRNRNTRTPVESTIRRVDGGAGGGGNTSIRKAHGTEGGAASATAWRVYALDWTADRVTVTLDGEPLTLTADPTRVPQGSMDLTIRLDPLDTAAAPGEEPTLSAQSGVRLLIDWIRIERFAG